ncbi:MAG: PDZ domain-containing protein, partial [Lachnospira sp.]|nr:PDZ domain-containing protein [Lachnospira sp.]
FGIYGKNVTRSMTGVYDVPVGLFISEVEIDSPAYDAGLQSGDVICEVNGNSVLTIQLFSEKLYRCSSGQSMMVRAKRKGKDGYYDVSFQVILGMR